jgi:hypothetical protein
LVKFNSGKKKSIDFVMMAMIAIPLCAVLDNLTQEEYNLEQWFPTGMP